MFTRILGIEYILVDYKGGSLRIGSCTTVINKGMQLSFNVTEIVLNGPLSIDYLHSDLSDGSILAKYVVHFFCAYFKGQVSHVQYPVNFRR